LLALAPGSTTAARIQRAADRILSGLGVTDEVAGVAET
jgi:hypothetical protein